MKQLTIKHQLGEKPDQSIKYQ